MIVYLWSFTFILVLLSIIKDRGKTIQALKASLKSLKKIALPLIGMVVLVGFILTVFPKEKIIWIFNYEGLNGYILVSLVGAIVTMPGPIAFPLAGSLLQMGASQELLASFITTLTMVGITTFPIEVSYFGKRFSFLRQGLNFISAILIGLIMRLIL